MRLRFIFGTPLDVFKLSVQNGELFHLARERLLGERSKFRLANRFRSRRAALCDVSRDVLGRRSVVASRKVRIVASVKVAA